MSTSHERLQRQRLTNLSPEKRTLLEKWVRERKDTAPTQTIPHRTGSGPVPLSFIQEWYWYEPIKEPLATLIEGPLQPSILEQSLNELIRRQEALRTTYHAVEGRPLQVVAPVLRVSLPLESLEHLREAEALEVGMRLLNEDFLNVELDLTCNPVFYTRLLRLTPEKHLFMIMTPGLMTDGRTESLLFVELMAIYEALTAGQPSPLPELPIQYADFAVWQHTHFQGAVLEDLLAYWRPRLADAPRMELPVDFPRPTSGSNHEDLPFSRVPDEQLEQLRSLAQAEGTTPFMIFLAAYQVLMLRFTGQYDCLVGVETSSRQFPETENILGAFTHMLPIRLLLDDALSFRTHLQRVRTAALDLYAHQGIHIANLADFCFPGRNMLKHPHFTASLAYLTQKVLRMEQHNGPLVLHPQLIGREEDVDELNLQLFDTWRGLQLSFLYNTLLFKRSTIEWLTESYLKLLTAIVTDPERPLSALAGALI